MNNGKVRIYELSKELNLDNKDILDICENLNIAVKSHSSTISESDAERIRSEAKNYIPTTQASGKSATSFGHDELSDSSSAKDKHKQQIVAIHHKNNGEGGASNSRSNVKTSTPVLAPPPQQPNIKETKVSIEDSVKSPQINRPTPTSASFKETLAKPIETKGVATPSINKPTPPKLVSPPNKNSQNKDKKDPSKEISPGKTPLPQVKLNRKSELPQLNSVDAPIKPRGDKQGIELGQKRETIDNKLPTKLQKRPQRGQPPSKDLSGQDVDFGFDDEDKNQEDDTVEVATLLAPPERPSLKSKPKRPAATGNVRKGKDKWEEEEEADKKAKATKTAKNTRRAKVLLEDEEEDLDDELLSDNEFNAAVSLSIARPPKPTSLTKTTTTAVVATKTAKKPTPKKEGKANKQEKREAQPVAGVPESIVLSGGLTVAELAQKLNTPETEIIKNLFFKGIAININQALDLDMAKSIAEELGAQVKKPEELNAASKTEMLDEKDLESLQLRPPVVTIMGHVDHGKTTLLDSIRNTKVAQGEAGGITQHIGAYHVDVEYEGKTQQIVFLDTPGHEAFTAMRARGAKVTDIAILVVAADDGVQPQTREAISHAQAAGVPIVVAINKVDKPEAQTDRIKQELTEYGLVDEEWGGETIMVPVSALKGDNLDRLLESIVLVAEVSELSANPDRPAKGTVIEANLDRAKGPVATLLVQNGTLRVGDVIVAGSVFGKIRAAIDDRGNKVEEAGPSFAVEVLGLERVPAAGDEFEVYASEREAKAIAEARANEQRQTRLQQASSSRRVSLSSLSEKAREGDLKELNLIIKADVQGSLEAILGDLQKLPQNEVQIRVLLAAPGEVTETDVDLAAASGAVIVGFNTTLASGSRIAADREGVDIRQYNIIYKLFDDIQGAMEGLLDPEEVEEPLGQAEVRAIFPVGRGSVAGCYVLSGKILRNSMMRVKRNNQVIHQGLLDSLKRMKEDAKEVNSGYECGIGGAKFNEWREGDIIESYQMVMKRRTLSAK